MTLRQFRSEVPFLIIIFCLALSSAPLCAAETQPDRVDASTLHHKVLCGYQGWFRCPGDPVNQGWIHWGRNRARLAPNNLTVEMWPDLTGFEPVT